MSPGAVRALFSVFTAVRRGPQSSGLSFLKMDASPPEESSPCKINQIGDYFIDAQGIPYSNVTAIQGLQ